MSQSKTMAIAAIHTVVCRTKLYITTITTRTEDKKLLYEYSSNPNAAKDFGTLEEARKIIPNLVNNSEKHFMAEPLEVPQAISPRPGTEFADWKSIK